MGLWHIVEYLTFASVLVLLFFRYLGNNPALIPLQPGTVPIQHNVTNPAMASGMKSVAYYVNWVRFLAVARIYLELLIH